jgi:apolipoprotein D and lipocalin family protein
LLPDGKIKVYNTQRDNSRTGPADGINGYAYNPDPSVPAKLKVHFDVAPVDAPCTVPLLARPFHCKMGHCNARSAMVRCHVPCDDCGICVDWVVAIGPQDYPGQVDCAPCYEWAVVSDETTVRHWKWW